MPIGAGPLRQLRVPAVFMRGGASNAGVFDCRQLPDDEVSRERLFIAVSGARTPTAGSSTAWGMASRRSPRSASSGRHRTPTRTWTTRSAKSGWIVPRSTGAAIAGTCHRPSDPSRWTRAWSKRPDLKASSSSTTPTPANSFGPGSRWRTGARPSKGRPRFPAYRVPAPRWISSSSIQVGRARARSSRPATSSTCSRSKAWEAFRSP